MRRSFLSQSRCFLGPGLAARAGSQADRSRPQDLRIARAARSATWSAGGQPRFPARRRGRHDCSAADIRRWLTNTVADGSRAAEDAAPSRCRREVPTSTDAELTALVAYLPVAEERRPRVDIEPPVAREADERQSGGARRLDRQARRRADGDDGGNAGHRRLSGRSRRRRGRSRRGRRRRPAAARRERGADDLVHGVVTADVLAQQPERAGAVEQTPRRAGRPSRRRPSDPLAAVSAASTMIDAASCGAVGRGGRRPRSSVCIASRPHRPHALVAGIAARATTASRSTLGASVTRARSGRSRAGVRAEASNSTTRSSAPCDDAFGMSRPRRDR